MTATTVIDFLQLPFRSYFASFFFSFSFLFPPLAVRCSWAGLVATTERKRGHTREGGERGSATDFCSCLFPWYRDCAISDELVKLVQSAVRLHVALALCPSGRRTQPPTSACVSVLTAPMFSLTTTSDRWRTANGTTVRPRF